LAGISVVCFGWSLERPHTEVLLRQRAKLDENEVEKWWKAIASKG
jgi:hypothetical protein